MFSKSPRVLLSALFLVSALGTGTFEGLASEIVEAKLSVGKSDVPRLVNEERLHGRVLEHKPPGLDAPSEQSPAGPPTARPPSDAPPFEKQQQAEKGDEVTRLKEQIVEAQNRGKLGFRKVVACSSVERFGVYSPLQPGAPISRLVLYFEPSNYSTLVTGDRHIIDCSVDLFVFNDKGKLIVGKKGILKMRRISRSPILDLFYKIRVDLKKSLRGDIVIKTVLHDNIKNDSVSANYRINVKSGKDRFLDGV
jgi:hypothetical protein